MRTSHILLLCILGAALFSSVICSSKKNLEWCYFSERPNNTFPVVSSHEIGPDSCCFNFYPKRVKKTLVRSYYVTDYRCPRSGVILVTQKSRHICVDPSLSWVESVMKSVDNSSV